MEEKIYFKPEGVRSKKKDKQGESKEKRNNMTLKIVGVTFFLFIAFFVAFWFLRGKTSVTGQYPENVRNESLSCVSNTIVYEKANERAASNREIRIDAVFYGKEKLSSIGLRYTQTFDTNEEAYGAEAILHAQFGGALQRLGHSFSQFNNKFSLMDNVLVLTLHAEANEIDDLTKDYFLINRNSSPKTLEDFQSNYEAQGFKCESILDNK